ncbi:MAG: TIGR02206 family membrane protein [Polyangiales bacterium]
MLPFRPFGVLHATIVLGTFAAAFALYALGRSPRSEGMRHRIAVALALLNGSMYLWTTALELSEGRWTPREGLPFHLCDLSAFVVAHALVTRNPRTFELGYYLGAIGGLAGLALPQVTRIDSYFVPFFTWHALLFVSPVYLVGAYGLRPRLRGIPETLLVTALLALPIGAIDHALGANYMFLRAKPRGAEAFPGAWPYYLPLMLAFGGVGLFLLWLPFAREARRGALDPSEPESP